MGNMRSVGNELAYAKNNEGQTVYIDEVPNGLSCNCTCPACGARLIAKNAGEINRHHFAHYSKTECEYTRQTNLHYMAEEILKEEKFIFLPPDYLDAGNWRFIFDPQSYRVQIDEIASEKRISDFVPDIVVKSGEMTILVEIYVTHKVDEAKKLKIEKEGKCFVVEIDLSDRAYDDLSKEEVKNLLKDQNRIRWIYRPDLNEMHKTFEDSKLKCDIVSDSTLVICPQGRSHRQRLDSCDNCSCYLGKDKKHVYCFYKKLFSSDNNTPYPKVSPLKSNMRKVLQPGDRRTFY